jgi:hypothetical protein
MRSRWVLVALLIAISTTMWWSTTYADSEENDCVSACEMQKQQCVEVCGDHSDPIECDADCRDAFEDCRQQCFR